MVSNEDCLTATAAQKLVNDPNYIIEEYVGKGAMACVYRATERGTPNVYAMKLLREQYRTDTQFIEFFKREAVSMRDLQYPNIVRFYTYSVQDDYAYILMDYVDGLPLTKLISKARRSGEMISLDLIMTTMAQIARAISYLHRKKYVHRDIKPGNVLLRENNEAYLTDLGIAGMVAAQEDDDMYLGAGTPSYMPYEQQTFQTVDKTADIYAFAITMYEMFTAKKPFISERGLDVKEARKQMVELHRSAEIPSLLKKRPELPPIIDTYFERALAKKPRDRYPDVMDFAKDVHEALVKANLISASLHDFDAIQPEPIPQAKSGRDVPATTTESASGKTPTQSLQSNMTPLLAIGAVVMVLIAIVGWLLSQQGAEDDALAVASDVARLELSATPEMTATQISPMDTLDDRFFAEDALSMVALGSVVSDVDIEGTTQDSTVLNLLFGSDGEADISLDDSVRGLEMTIALDGVPPGDAFSYGVRYEDVSVAVVGENGMLALRYGDDTLARYDDSAQLPQTITIRVREDAVQIETLSFDDDTVLYDVEATTAPISELSLIFTDLVPDVLLARVALSVVGEDIGIEAVPALSVMQSGARALRATGTASDVITCSAFVDVYDGIQTLRTADGVNALLTMIERINSDIYEACEGEDSITAGLGWADEMDALIDDFSP